MRIAPAALVVFLLPFPVNAEVRTWTDSTGTHKTEAEFVNYSEGVVQLRKKDTGSILSIPINQLSFDDQWVVRRNVAPKKIQAYLDWLYAHRLEETANLKKSIADCDARITKCKKIVKNPTAELQARAKSGKVDRNDLKSNYVRDNREKIVEQAKTDLDGAQRQRDKLEQSLKDLNSRGFSEKLHRTLMPKTFELGQIGRLGDSWDFVRVLQVIGPTEFIVMNTGPNGELHSERLTKTFLIRGLPTNGMANGSILRPSQLFEVSDTYRYETVAGGTNTIFVLEVIDLSPYLPMTGNRPENTVHQRPSVPLNFWTIVHGRLAVGQVGVLSRVRVLQVMSDNEMLAVVELETRVSEPFLLRGIPTKGIVDGARPNLGQRLKVTRTQRYDAVNGAERTIFVLEPIDQQDVNPTEK